jgi:hypothetical protein
MPQPFSVPHDFLQDVRVCEQLHRALVTLGAWLGNETHFFHFAVLGALVPLPVLLLERLKRNTQV